MRERSYNKGHTCETCSKPVVNGYKRCRKHVVFTLEHRNNLKISHKKKMKNGTWRNQYGAYKGDEVGYRGLHHWVDSRLGKPTKCEHCGEDKLKGRKIHWANKSGEYRRKLTDWIRLCAKCHGQFDSKRRINISQAQNLPL